ncbi:BREX-1 system adenine-specific DNA-methyltransferase PglX [Corynebacterium sanguinis]
MDTTLLKSFATSSRTELIREVAARITAVLAPGSPERVEQPRAVSELEHAISVGGGGDKGKAHVADKVAYTWFNRIIALRFMDANGYTGIGVVSPAADQVGQPEILAAAKRGQVDGDVVKGANVATVTGLLNGTRQPRPGVDAQAEAYSLLLADYCRYWNRAMPFMFEREGDFTELLIPANVLAEDSVLSRSVTVLTEEVCQDVEVIGWLYQFYISERKDEVFTGFKKNKKAGADEIPAATQLFTPHWIVCYLVENSVGRLWMLNHPESRLVDQMDYYIAPVDEETDFLKITKPEELTVIDPACGSGHMLTYAFDLLYAIYEEEGYTPSQIPGLILTNNLYGTEIDPRAGALAAFALAMKAAAKRKLFLKNPVEPNICVLEQVSFSAEELSYLVSKEADQNAEAAFLNQFAQADTVGSLIQPDPALVLQVSKHLVNLGDEGDIFRAAAIDSAQQVVRQAEYLLPRYSVAVANPPYMIQRNYGAVLSAFLKRVYPMSAADIFAPFIERCLKLTAPDGLVAMITKQTWMFGSSFADLRDSIIRSSPIVSLAHLGTAAFDSIGGEVVNTVAFVMDHQSHATSSGTFMDVRDGADEASKSLVISEVASGTRQPFLMTAQDFAKIPGGPIAYWVGNEIPKTWVGRDVLKLRADLKSGISTGDNARFERMWWEVSRSRISGEGAASMIGTKRWTPAWSGGEFRRWFGNALIVMDWEDDGRRIRAYPGSAVRNPQFQGRSGITYTKIGGATFAGRAAPAGYVFDDAGRMIFPHQSANAKALLAFLNSSAAQALLDVLTPGLNYTSTEIGLLPWEQNDAISNELEELALSLVETARIDWNDFEVSRDFTVPSIVSESGNPLSEKYANWSARWRKNVRSQANLERRNNELVARALALEDVIPVDVGLHRVSLGRNVEFRFGRGRTAEAYTELEMENLASEVISFGVGCMFGRYSLDEPGLILADQGATLQDYLAKVQSPTFEPDADNVIPIVDGDWFEDDIVERFRVFLRAAFGEQHFEENLQFVTKSLGVKHLRDYFVRSFYKDHIKRYKKRPIYWLFSSPKGSFNALIYLHRYTPSTVSTVLTYLREYVTKLESALQQAERAGNAKEADRLRKILVELNEFEHDTLFPKASENIVIDLDDGVKVNYPKFGAALKKVPGLEAASD